MVDKDIKKSFLQNIPMLIIIVGVFVLFNLIGTCSTKSSLMMANKMTQEKMDLIIENQNKILNNLDSNDIQLRIFFLRSLEKESLRFLLYENAIDQKQLSVSELKLRLENLEKIPD